jgi:hypothetical protein
VLAIYSTLGLAGQLAELLREEGLLTNLFFLSMFMIAATVLALGLKMRPAGAEIGVALGVAAVYILLFIRMGITIEERTHLMEYSVVGALIYQALIERHRNRHLILPPALIAILLTTLLGLLDEGIQHFLPNRVFDPIDILFNFLAGLLAILASYVLASVRARYRPG